MWRNSLPHALDVHQCDGAWVSARPMASWTPAVFVRVSRRVSTGWQHARGGPSNCERPS